ncbi:hypothetical protein Hypma_010827 [Hypsizygus marmoreus]|uniref:Uncharacterized protein n=1 Tax=Hypsizygus marmoreus TaxID=39966 RepID=A0A369JN51_HYPMA|nr:hypothetical protein Hypma_010827 [Hypsizygus marmoreus]
MLRKSTIFRVFPANLRLYAFDVLALSAIAAFAARSLFLGPGRRSYKSCYFLESSGPTNLNGAKEFKVVESITNTGNEN